MRRFLCLLLFAISLHAESKWIQSRSGPVEIYSDAPTKIALEKLGFFEQFRFALGTLVGKPDLNSSPPIRLIVSKAPTAPSASFQGRDRIAIPISSERPIPPSVLRDATRLLLNQNIARLPPEIEKGIEDFFSTVDVRGAHVVWGAPPPAPERNLDWARIQLLATKPEYYGKLKILMFNLQKGIADDPAYRNSIGKTKKEFDSELAAYFQAGLFTSADGPGRPMNAQRDLSVKPLDPSDVQLATADLLNAESRAAYQAILASGKRHYAEASEGLAILALRDHDEAAALKYLTDATDARSTSPGAWIAYAKLENDRPKSNDAIETALELDPQLAEAHFLKGQRHHDEEELKKATALDPRQSDYWNALAEVYLDDNKFPEAAKSYRQAEQAAADPAEQERMRRAWSRIETEKLDYQDSEKRRVSGDEQRELQRLKDKALADLHAAEERINRKLGSSPTGPVVPWNEAGLPVLLVGELRQVECLGNTTMILIDGRDRQTVKLLLKDRGELKCGPQQLRPVSVEYMPKPDAKLGTAGELVVLP
jgi:Tfp pilus assembly protein PilF